jgi:hypothetical protein
VSTWSSAAGGSSLTYAVQLKARFSSASTVQRGRILADVAARPSPPDQTLECSSRSSTTPKAGSSMCGWCRATSRSKGDEALTNDPYPDGPNARAFAGPQPNARSSDSNRWTGHMGP